MSQLRLGGAGVKPKLCARCGDENKHWDQPTRSWLLPVMLPWSIVMLAHQPACRRKGYVLPALSAHYSMSSASIIVSSCGHGGDEMVGW